ncbi:MAG TPA: inorganic phosphate transporter [Planctomycetota bacterium]|nr:inorganic phosphate transporter [Planctomycetota bacterium]
MTTILILAVVFLAYSNGANDNFKGVASIYGSGTTSYGKALAWATLTTVAGSIASFFFAQALFKQFSGGGFVPDTIVAPAYLLAVALGAGATVILATRFGFPISTTHGLTGAMLGAGLVAVGSSVNFSLLGATFLLPLLLSPVLAVAVGGILYGVFHFARVKMGITREMCVCVGVETSAVGAPQTSAPAAMPAGAQTLTATVDNPQRCEERYAGKFLGVNCQSVVDAMHFLSAGALSFARGWNDTPKIVAPLIVLKAMGLQCDVALVAAAMAIGGLLNARRIAETMSKKITAMNHGQAFTSNLAAAALVIAASKYGLPVSTTHVTVGSLFGIGVVTRKADLKTITGIVLSWLVTLPCAAAIGASVYWVFAR